MGNKCKYIITFLVILSFLCQNFSLAYGGDKLAPRSRVDDPKLRAAAAAYAEMLAEQGEPTDPDDDLPPSGSVVRSIIAALLIPILVFMWLISPTNINTAFAKSPTPAVQKIVPQWVIDMEEVIRLEQFSQEPTRYSASIQYDSLGGGFVSGNADFESGLWGIGGLGGIGNPLYGLDEDGVGGIGSVYWRLRENLWLSFRGGQLPDYSPDSTYFGLVGIDADTYVLHPYLHLGLLHRSLDGDSGEATGLLLNTGLNVRWRRIEGGFSASGPLYFRPTAGTIEDYRRVLSDLSLLRARMRYSRDFWWVGGVAEGGSTKGLTKRLDSNLPAYGFSRFGVDGGLRFDRGPVNGVLGATAQLVSPSFAVDSRIVAGPSVNLTWRDLSLRGGALFGPFVRPYGEVLYRVARGLEVSGGFNAIPPLYATGFYDDPWDPRNLVTFGLRYDYGASARSPVYPRDEYPVQTPTGRAMDRLVYGPFRPLVEDMTDRLNEATKRFERSLTSAAASAKTFKEVYAIFEKLQERIHPDMSSSLSGSTAFWNGYYMNPNIDFYWIYSFREKLHTEDEYKSWHESYGYSYGDILERLLNRRYEVSDYRFLYLLIDEFNQLMNTVVEEGVDREVLDNTNSLFKLYKSRLDETKPGSPEFIFTYYVASRLFYVLVKNGKYPGVSALTRLTEAYLMIPLDSVKLDMEMIMPDEKIIQELRSQYTDWIKQDDPKAQIQGLLVLELLLFEAGGVMGSKEGMIAHLYEIFRRVIPTTEPVPVPLVPLTPENEYYLRIKAAALALDILVKMDMPIEEKDIDYFKFVYEGLPRHLQERLKTDSLRELLDKPKAKTEVKPGPGLLEKHAGNMRRFLLPMIAGLFLTGCSGTGIGSVAGIGMLSVLAAVASMVGTRATTPHDDGTRKTYRSTGNKAVDDFMGAIVDKRTILALDTDIGNLKDPAISLLATLERLSRSGQLGGITFIRAGGNELRDKIEKAVGEDKDINVVLVCKNTNRDKFDGLRGAFITSVDDSVRDSAYIPILEILTLSLRMASKAKIDEVKELYREITNQELTEELYISITNGLLLVLPPIQPIDYEALKRIYESQKELLLSA